MGVSVEIVRKPPKPLAEEVAKRWAEEWAKEGKDVHWQRLIPPRGFRVLPRRWVVERTFAWISHNRRMAKETTREIVRNRGGVRLGGHDEAHGEAVGPCVESPDSL